MSARLSEFPKAVLAIDCSLGGCIAAVKRAGSDEIFSRVFITEREQAAKLVPMVREVMAEADVAMADLGLIVTSVGPGSFTGLRIGLSSARAMGLALGIPVQGVGTLDIMMAGCAAEADTQGYFVAIETKRTDFYVQACDRQGNVLIDARCVNAADIAEAARGRDFILCGDGVARLRAELGDLSALFSDVRERVMLEPAALLERGLEMFINNNGVAEKPEPVYLRGADVSMSNKAQRVIKDIP